GGGESQLQGRPATVQDGLQARSFPGQGRDCVDASGLSGLFCATADLEAGRRARGDAGDRRGCGQRPLDAQAGRRASESCERFDGCVAPAGAVGTHGQAGSGESDMAKRNDFDPAVELETRLAALEARRPVGAADDNEAEYWMSDPYYPGWVHSHDGRTLTEE